jgi:two-component system phosphate regulon sensor histidine kinase PhoR
MTHELKTPISTISISAEVLLREDTFENSERIQQYAKIIRAENNRLEAQVEKVLQLAKLEKEQIQLNRSIINLHTIVKEVSETFEITIKEREGQLNLDLSASQQSIDADPIHITNVISSLFDNANKYSPDNPVITVRSQNDLNAIRLMISDNGKGIPSNDLKNIFEKFYRVPTGDVHDVKGFGLGLFYVRSILKAHDGSIAVESKPLEGSTFTITLPLTQST